MVVYGAQYHYCSKIVRVNLREITSLSVLPDAVGRGAWQDWSYEVQVVNRRTNTTSTLRPERGRSVTVIGLLAGCVYDVRVRASSTEGSGPWSTDFTAQTLSAGKLTFAEDVMFLSWLIGWFVSQHSTGLLKKVTD